MARSLLLDGILAENPEAARAQVWAYDHATVGAEASRRLTSLAKWAAEKVPSLQSYTAGFQPDLVRSAPADPTRHARDDGLILPIEPVHWRAAKLGRILKHFDLACSADVSGAELIDLCLQAEARAVARLQDAAGPRRIEKGVAPFTGQSIAELSRYVLRRLFEQLDANFAKQPLHEQERIAAEIAHGLSELPPEIRERVEREAGLTELSVSALKRTGTIAAIGGALVGSVGLGGFAAYTTLTSLIASAAGFVGLTLPFAVYIHATAALAFLSNPVVLAAATLLGGGFAVSRANHQMRDRLVPVMIATSILASTTTPEAQSLASMVIELSRYQQRLRTADRKLTVQIHNTFQCLPRTA